ncbi:MAG: hypothetical protein Q7J84_18415 [Sulfuricaulis sp.]|nr:hypothetical protein [Sulfuricaulis sp.]
MARKLLIKLFLFFCAVTLATAVMTANAAPLASGTALKIAPGVGSANNIPCASGSCIAAEAAPGFVIWIDLKPGTDGGFIVGKSQTSGGQETGPDPFNNTAPGQVTAASFITFGFASGNATLFTLPDGGSVNIFDDASCTKAACIGKTALMTLNVAVNGNSIPIGSAAGCTGPGGINCSPDQLAGIFVNNYTIDLVGKTWSMDYAQAVPTGPFQGMKFFLIFRGTVANCPVVDFAWQSPNSQVMLVFGSQLTGVTGVVIDGVNAPLFQEVGESVLLVLFPSGVSLPWKPGTVQVTTRAGCSGSFPKPCGA